MNSRATELLKRDSWNSVFLKEENQMNMLVEDKEFIVTRSILGAFP